MRKDVTRNLARIVKCLLEAEEGWLWIREIGRRTRLHHKTVSRLIDTHLSMFVEEQDMPGLNIRMIKLKPEARPDGILKFIKIKEKIGR
jgi:hypothetical protein